MNIEKTKPQESEKIKVLEIYSEIPKKFAGKFPEKSWNEMDTAYSKIYEKYGLLKNNGELKSVAKMADQAEHGTKALERPEKNAYRLTLKELLEELGISEVDLKKILNESGNINSDGTYTEKETGRTYETGEVWLKKQYTDAKKYYSVSDEFKRKADREWARYKNSEENGETETEKSEHYLKSQEYYEKMKRCAGTADKIVKIITKKEFDNTEQIENKRSVNLELTSESKSAIEDGYNIIDKITGKAFSDASKTVIMETIFEDNENLLSEIYGYDIDDFNFDDADFNFDKENLKKLSLYVNYNSWKKFDVDDRDIVMDFANELSRGLRLDNPPKVKFYYGDIFECGSYNLQTNTIKINRYFTSDPKMVIDIIAHETWHAYQHQCAENPQTKKDLLYAINFENYISPIKNKGKWMLFDEYEGQLVEAEARAFSKFFLEMVGGNNGYNS